ncbi:hypothetical protein RI367_004306 [Sorochytrium milnesiophthora]
MEDICIHRDGHQHGVSDDMRHHILQYAGRYQQLAVQSRAQDALTLFWEVWTVLLPIPDFGENSKLISDQEVMFAQGIGDEDSVAHLQLALQWVETLRYQHPNMLASITKLAVRALGNRLVVLAGKADPDQEALVGVLTLLQDVLLVSDKSRTHIISNAVAQTTTGLLVNRCVQITSAAITVTAMMATTKAFEPYWPLLLARVHAMARGTDLEQMSAIDIGVELARRNVATTYWASLLPELGQLARSGDRLVRRRVIQLLHVLPGHQDKCLLVQPLNAGALDPTGALAEHWTRSEQSFTVIDGISLLPEVSDMSRVAGILEMIFARSMGGDGAAMGSKRLGEEVSHHAGMVIVEIMKKQRIGQDVGRRLTDLLDRAVHAMPRSSHYQQWISYSQLLDRVDGTLMRTICLHCPTAHRQMRRHLQGVISGQHLPERCLTSWCRLQTRIMDADTVDHLIPNKALARVKAVVLQSLLSILQWKVAAIVSDWLWDRLELLVDCLTCEHADVEHAALKILRVLAESAREDDEKAAQLVSLDVSVAQQLSSAIESLLESGSGPMRTEAVLFAAAVVRIAKRQLPQLSMQHLWPFLNRSTLDKLAKGDGVELGSTERTSGQPPDALSKIAPAADEPMDQSWTMDVITALMANVKVQDCQTPDCY